MGGTSGSTIDLTPSAGVDVPDAGSEDVGACKTEQVGASVLPTRLVFVFDVSGSMGEGDYPWHDKTLKWDPVVAATKGFFADPGSQGISASLVFFPVKDEAKRCVADTYAKPNVPMTALPSSVFGSAIDRQGPDGSGTPTVAAITGSLTYIRQQNAVTPGKYVMVLATDGYPQSCGDSNSIANAANIVSGARSEGISTYVIGVKNPPISGAPEVVANLSQIATAGGTTLFLLDTGSPAATQQAFSAAINQIRGAAIACDIPIPPPPTGRTFDKEKVILTYSSGANAPTAFTYDPECTGSNGWRYDNRTTPTRVVLCPSTCTAVQADPKAVLSVGFACEQVITVIP
jgi:von Willebrand factor type A domain